MPVSILFAVTVAPEIAAPDGSVMTPDKFADTCARENGTNKPQKMNNQVKGNDVFCPRLDFEKVHAN